MKLLKSLLLVVILAYSATIETAIQADPLDAYITSIASSEGVPRGILHSVCFIESTLRPSAYRRHDGSTPSYGICQIKYKTAKHLGFHGKPKDLQIVELNLYFAAKYLNYQHNRYKDWLRAIEAYNKGRSTTQYASYTVKVINHMLEEK